MTSIGHVWALSRIVPIISQARSRLSQQLGGTEAWDSSEYIRAEFSHFGTADCQLLRALTINVDFLKEKQKAVFNSHMLKKYKSAKYISKFVYIFLQNSDVVKIRTYLSSFLHDLDVSSPSYVKTRLESIVQVLQMMFIHVCHQINENSFNKQQTSVRFM